MESVRVRTARLLDDWESYARENVPKWVGEFEPDTFGAAFSVRLAEGFLESLRELGLYEVYDMGEAPLDARMLYEQVKGFVRHEVERALRDAGYQFVTEVLPFPEGVSFRFCNY